MSGSYLVAVSRLILLLVDPSSVYFSGTCQTFTMTNMSQPQTPEDRRKSIRITDKLEIPSIDTRKYRVIRLHNQLEVLLVHDADTDMASAAMDVNVGCFSDELDMPGVAHGVE